MPYPLNSEPNKPDERYHVALEWCGAPEPKHVLRFCGNWIAKFDSYDVAAYAAYRHDSKRMGVCRPKDFINFQNKE